MGLDMMLYRKNFNQSGNERDLKEVMYWRKANAIHEWFVSNVQDGIDECEPHDVTVGQLTELRNLCTAVIIDNSLAEELLPTTSGFFFGSTDYDNWYFENLKETVEALDCILIDSSPDDIFVYRSSW